MNMSGNVQPVLLLNNINGIELQIKSRKEKNKLDC